MRANENVNSPEGKDYSIQRLLLGTHTSDGEPNYLQIATVQLPKVSSEMDPRSLDEERGEYGGYGANSQCRINIVQRIPHDGEVNRARYMPDNPCVIATKTVSGEVHIFDYTKHPSQPVPGATPSPDLRLRGQTREGYGLVWNTRNKGILASSSEDMTVCIWDIKTGGKENRVIDPLRVFRKHTAVVGDVSWNWNNENILATVGDDRKLFLYQARVLYLWLLNLDGTCARTEKANQSHSSRLTRRKSIVWHLILLMTI